jgi:hypothetical protein
VSLGSSDTVIPLYPSLNMDAAGTSYCYMLEAKAAVSLSPLGAGVGLSLAFSEPLGVELCLTKGLGLEDQIELRIWGPGLAYSTSLLQDELASLAQKVFSLTENLKGIQLDRMLRVVSSSGFGDLLVSSLYGTSLVVDSEVIHLDLHGVWLVSAATPWSGPRHEIIEIAYSASKHVSEAALKFITDVEEGLELHYRVIGRYAVELMPKRMAKLVEILRSSGILGLTTDITAEHVVILVDDFGTLLDIIALLTSYGVKHSYGRIAHPH